MSVDKPTTFKVTVGEDGYEKILSGFSAKLKEFFISYLDIEAMYDDSPTILANELLGYLSAIKSHSRGANRAIVKELIDWLEKENSQLVGRVNNMKEKGVISFETLQHLLEPGTEVVIMSEKHNQGARVVSSSYEASFFGPYLNIQYEYIGSGGRQFKFIREDAQIYHFKGVKDINTLQVKPISKDERDVLTKRGHVYKKVGVGANYVQMAGHMEVKNWWYWVEMRATGRCMIDTATYDLFKHNRDGVGRADGDAEDGSVVEEITDDLLWLSCAYVWGFSFVTKQWGRFSVASLSDIEFRSEAFEHLVLDPDKKKLIKALVTDSSSGFQDLISGKGGGCIFLLHGDPGVGKTLTAEAIAELLRRPLYSVSVGELGTNPEVLEKNLRQILDVAQIWEAVILIDEADIFLEARTSGDILRNAMVGIFLRLLEYHQGVMFLTTNRVKNFDQAFHSRISIALKYSKLDRVAREKIWVNLLSVAGITGIDAKELSETDINGRQIKNTIRLAQGLARQDGVAVNKSHIMATIDVSKQFQNDLKSSKD